MAKGQIRAFFKKVFNAIFYGGLSKENYIAVQDDVFAYNRKMVIFYSLFASCIFLILALLTSLTNITITKNKILYMIATVAFALVAVINRLFSKKHHFILGLSEYFCVISFFSVGIVLAVNSAYDVTASYMVLLFAVPMLMVLRPFTISMVIILTNIIYILLMYKLEPTELFHKNLINAIIYGTTSVMVSTSIIIMKFKKHEADYLNKQLLYKDQLTGLLNRHAYNDLLKSYTKKPIEPDFVYFSMDLNGLKTVNDTYGHIAGDDFIISSALCIKNAFEPYDQIFRIGGDEFVALLHMNSKEITNAIVDFQKQLSLQNDGASDLLSISVGFSTVQDDKLTGIDALARLADKRMYDNKRKYYESNGHNRRR